jgi:hypothetical protein
MKYTDVVRFRCCFTKCINEVLFVFNKSRELSHAASWFKRKQNLACLASNFRFDDYYLPPNLNVAEIDEFHDYINNCYDKLCVESPQTVIILGGDFNPASNGFQQKRLI